MTTTPENQFRRLPPKERGRLAQGLLTTIPIVLVGSLAMNLNLTGPLDQADAEPQHQNRASPTELGKSIREALAAAHAASTVEATTTGTLSIAAVAPSTYTVAAGDTVSGIAGRFGLATASVLALNGLGWKASIFPGQILKLTNGASNSVAPSGAPAASASGTRYTIVAGDTISKIATHFNTTPQSILSANGLRVASVIYPGGTLAIPGSSGSAPARSTAGAASATPAVSIKPLAPGVSDTAHMIKAGETIAGIATSYGVSVQSILNANGLGWSSIIFGGRTLVIPGVPVAAATANGVTPLTPEMAQSARTIIGVGRSLGVSDYGLVVALATAMQESSLRNIAHGDRDSLGLFQQRPSTGWGSRAQLADPAHASKLFFGGRTNPNRGTTRGLLDIPGWQSKTVTQAAQAVQISAYPEAYAKWEVSAWAWLDALG